MSLCVRAGGFTDRGYTIINCSRGSTALDEELGKKSLEICRLEKDKADKIGGKPSRGGRKNIAYVMTPWKPSEIVGSFLFPCCASKLYNIFANFINVEG